MNEYMDDENSMERLIRWISATQEDIEKHTKTMIGIMIATLVAVITGAVLIIVFFVRSIQDLDSEVLNCSMRLNRINEQCNMIRQNVQGDGCSGEITDIDDPINPVFDDSELLKKPNIYIYPDERQEAHVKLSLNGPKMRVSYPAPSYAEDNTCVWDVLAEEDGRIYMDDKEYSYIFWEADDNTQYSFDEGFCVAGADTAEFLQKTLADIGLTPREYNEFIVYWLPQMQDNAYNLISFKGLDKNDVYNQTCELTVTDAQGREADSMLRLMMVWKALDAYEEITPQEFSSFERSGFTVVEWGGIELK